MKNNIFRKVKVPNIRMHLWAMTAFACTITYYNIKIGFISILILLYLVYHNWKIEYAREKMWTEYVENLSTEMDNAAKEALINLPIPLTVVEFDGDITWYNSKFTEIVDTQELLQRNIEDVIHGFKISNIINRDSNEEKMIQVTIKDKHYKILYNIVKLNEEEKYSIIFYWIDMTNYENLKTIYNNEKSILAYVLVDNYDDIISSVEEERKPMLVAEIDKQIRLWSTRMNASITKYDDDKYKVVFENQHLEKLEAKKFTILDEIREIETNTDFPVTLSIGVGVNGKNPSQLDEYANAALDLALGRGGDQAVIKKINKFEYYGGKSQAVEKRNKGKSRIMAHALKQLIEQSSNVIIMGHENPDMDSFGASLGVYRMAKNQDKEVDIILNNVNDAIYNIYQSIKNTGNYSFITKEEAMAKTQNDTVVVVLDTHRPSFTQCPKILDIVEKKVVIDHHRRAAEYIDDAVLTYIEPYASSTCELITEIMQYISDKKNIERIEAEALLAGINMDTKSFTFKTGVRTFEAASWLRRVGADTTNVRQLFQDDMDTFIEKAKVIKNAKAIGNNIALSICESQIQSKAIVVAQAADELLNIRGITASFVLGKKGTDDVFISARSLGDINVQVILEKLGGGGHLTIAGAQLKNTTIDEAVELLTNTIDEFFEEGEKQ